MPMIRLKGGDDNVYSKFDDLIEFKDFDYAKEMNAVHVDRIEVVVNEKTKFCLKAKREI